MYDNEQGVYFGRSTDQARTNSANFIKPVRGAGADYHTIYKIVRYDEECDTLLEEWGIHIRGPNELCFLVFDTFSKAVEEWTPTNGFESLTQACEVITRIANDIPHYLRRMDRYLRDAVAQPPDAAIPSECRFKGQ